MDDVLVVDVTEAARRLSISESMVRKLARTGRLKVRHIGHRALYAPSDLARLALGGDEAETEDATAS